MTGWLPPPAGFVAFDDEEKDKWAPPPAGFEPIADDEWTPPPAGFEAFDDEPSTDFQKAQALRDDPATRTPLGLKPYNPPDNYYDVDPAKQLRLDAKADRLMQEGNVIRGTGQYGPEETGFTDYAAEVFKGVPRGAVSATGQMVRGAATMQTSLPEDVDEAIAGMERFPQMTQRERIQWFDKARGVFKGEAQEMFADLYNNRLRVNRPVTPEEIATLRAKTPQMRIEETPAYQTGKAIEAFGRENLPQDERFKDSWTSTLSEGAGSTVPYLAAGLLPGGAALGTAAGVMGSSGEATDTALQGGATQRQIMEAARLGVMPGLTEQIPIEILLRRVPAGIRNGLARAIYKGAEQAAIEGGQEGVAQFGQNLIEKYTYNPDKDVMEDVWEQAGIGAIIGSGLGVAVSPFQGEGKAAPQPTTDAKADRLPVPQPAPQPTRERMADRQQPAPDTAGILRQIGYTDEQIADMAPTEAARRAEEARPLLQGRGQPPALPAPSAAAPAPTKPTQNIPQNIPAPVPGTAPWAPRQQFSPQFLNPVTEQPGAPTPSPELATRRAPLRIEGPQDVEAASAAVDTAPTEPQKAAGNYAHGHVRLHGLDISIENPKGSIRSGRSRYGEDWSVEMPAAYGYIKRTRNTDGEQVDVYVGENPASDRAFVIDQINPRTGKHDEFKTVLGVNTQAEAEALYDAGFADGSGPRRRKATAELSVDGFKDWLASGSKKMPVAEAPAPPAGAPQAAVQPEEAPVQPPAQVPASEAPRAAGEVSGISGQLPDARRQARVSEYLASTAPLDPQRLAKRLNVTPKEATRILAQEAAAGRVRYTRTGRFLRVPKREQKPVSLVEFLIDGGGIRLEGTRGNLKAQDLDKVSVRFRGKLVTTAGMTIDEALERSVAAGYVGQQDRYNPDAEATATTDDLIEAIRNETFGEKVYSDDDAALVEQQRAKAQEARDRDELETRYDPEQRAFIEKYGAMLLEFLEAQGMRERDFTAPALERAKALVDRGMKPEDALESAVVDEHNDEDAYEDREAEAAPDSEDVPFAGEEVRPRPEGQGEPRAEPVAAGPGEEPAQPRAGQAAAGAVGPEGEGGREGPVDLTQAQALAKRFRAGEMSATEAVDAFDRVRANADAIKAELNKKTKQELTRDPRLRAEKKDRIVKTVFMDLLNDFNAAGSYSYGMYGDPADAIRKAVAKQTDEDIKASVERRQARNKEFLQTYTDPQTLSQFRSFVTTRGADKLTPEQKERYDALVADEVKADAKATAARQAVVKKVEAEGVTTKIIETKHTQKGHDLFVVQMSERVEKEVYHRLADAAKKLGGYYSSYTKGGAVPGFQFKTRDAAEQFSKVLEGDVVKEAPTVEEKQKPVADKFRKMAETMDERAEESLSADRKTNTERRARMATGAEMKAAAEKAMATTLRNIADGIEGGDIRYLDQIRNKVDVELLEGLLRSAKVEWQRGQKNPEGWRDLDGMSITREMIEKAPYLYASSHRDNIRDLAQAFAETSGMKRTAALLIKEAQDAERRGDWQVKGDTPAKLEALIAIADAAVKNPKTKYEGELLQDSIRRHRRMQAMGLINAPTMRTALREYLDYRGETAKTDPIKAAERALIGRKIPGYFPTPKALVERMVEQAGIRDGMTILEPSAGKGNIADALKAAAPKSAVSAIEPVGDLRKILEIKGHAVVGHDFLEHEGTYDRIVMNPPFENGQDIDHVRHAYDLLEPGGRVVAIMSEGPFYRSDKKATEFRDWLDGLDGTSEKLPDGSFKDAERSTGVATRLVVIDKPAATVERTEAGPQTVLPGAERSSDAVMAQRKAGAPLKGKVAQRLTMDEGLFGDKKDQSELFSAPTIKPRVTEGASVAAKGQNYQFAGDFKPGPRAGDRAKKAVLAAGRKNGVENIVAIDEDGNILADGRGTRSSVGFSEASVAACRDPSRRVVVHHNHPNNSSLSVQDHRALAKSPGMAALYAHTPDGLTARIVIRNPKVRTEFGAFESTANMAQGFVTARLQRRMEKLPPEQWQAEIDTGVATAKAAHMFNLALRDMGAIWYDFTGAPVLSDTEMRDVAQAVKSFGSGWDDGSTDRSTVLAGHPGEMEGFPEGSPQLAEGDGSARGDDLAVARGDREEAVAPRSQQAAQRIRAYHGSPHDFDRFDITKIGTGEGAQVFGHGLYVAESEGVAREYQEKLSRDVAVRGVRLSQVSHPTDSPEAAADHDVAQKVSEGVSPSEAIKLVAREWRDAATPYEEAAKAGIDGAAEVAAQFHATAAAAEKMNPRDFVKNKGRMYEVTLNVDDEKIIDYDSEQQPAGVLEAFRQIGFTPTPGTTGGTMYRDLGDFLANRDGGMDLTPYKGSVDVLASAVLKDHGIQGIRYFDQGSRTKGEGTRNYVIFDDKLIEIARKFYSRGNQKAGRAPSFVFNGKSYTARMTPVQRWTLLNDMQAFVDRMVGPGRVDLLGTDRLADPNANASFYPGERVILMAFSMVERGADPTQVLAHEIGHGIRELGLFGKDEWPLLERVAAAEWMDKYDIVNRYQNERWGHLTNHQIGKLLLEEAVFEALGDHVSGRLRQQGPIGRIFDRIARLFRDIRIWLADQKGFGSVSDLYRIEQVFDRALAGEMGRRAEKSGDVRDFDLEGMPQQSRSRYRPIAPGAAFEAPRRDFYDDLADRSRSFTERIDRAAQTALRTPRRLFQDRMVELARYQEAITDATGQPIPEYQDAYLAEELFQRRTGEKLQDLRDTVVDPLVQAIYDEGLTLQDVDEYLYARHAIERNEAIAELYRDKPNHQFVRALTDPDVKGGSGLSAREVRDASVAWRQSGKLARLRRIAPFVDAMNRTINGMQLSAGLISQEEYDNRKRYRFYVPLRGWENDPDALENDPDMPRVGARFNVKGKEAKAALGRTSKADSPLTYSILQAQQTIIRAEKNRVDHAFLRLAQANPHPGVWEVNKVKTERFIDKATGLARERRVTDMDPNTNLFLKVGGKQYAITIHDRSLHRAMTGTQSVNVPALIHKMVRLYTATRTSYNPEFVIANFQRDIQTALVNATDAQVKGLHTAIIKNTMKAVAGILDARFREGRGRWAQNFRDFEKHGGKVSYFDMQNVEQIKEDMLGQLATMQPDAWKNPKAVMAILNRTLLQPIDKVNEAVENGVRLATYQALIDAGVSKDKAASYAGNLTTNFTRKGEFGQWVNVFYPFFNASLQGSVRLVQAMRNKNVRRISGAIIAAAATRSILNAMMSGEDDDGELFFDKIPSYVKERNMVFMIPAWMDADLNKRGAYIKWALPWGYNVFDVMGAGLVDVARGVRTPLEGALNVGKSMVASFNPIGYGSNFLQFMMPSLVDPAIELAQNRDFLNRPIMPERLTDDARPESQRYFESVNPLLRSISEWLNDATGGNDAKPGVIDVSPETLEHWVAFGVGATGTFVTRVQTLIQKGAAGEDIEPYQIPFARALYAENSDYLDTGRYHDIKRRVQEYENQLKLFRSTGDETELDRLQVDYKPEAAALGAFKSAEKTLRKLRDQRRAIKATKNISEDEKAKQIDEIRKQENAVMLQARKAYHGAGGRL